jgi:hypothetical protein
MVLPTVTVDGLKLGAEVLLGATRIVPNEAVYVEAVPAPTLLVAVVTETLATR